VDYLQLIEKHYLIFNTLPMSKELEQLKDSITFMHEHFSKIRDDLMRTFDCGSHEFPAKEYADRANEIAQLGCLPVAMMNEPMVKEVRERLACAELGIKHEKRIDFTDMWKDDDRR